MSKTTIIVVVVLISAMAIFVSVFSFRLVSNSPEINVITRTEGFTGNTFSIPQETVDKVFETAKANVLKRADSFKAWNLATIALVWLAFLFSGITTIIAGYWGQATADAQANAQALIDELKKKRRSARMVGIIAAMATICSAASVKSREFSESEKLRATTLRDTIVSSYADLGKAVNEAEAFAVLEKLRVDSEL